MKVSNSIWKDRLAGSMPDQLAAEIEQFENEIQLRKQGGIDEVVFAETRLRRGAYGQRYDNGLRHDGAQQQTLPFDDSKNTKGANTIWDAPGMQRIKIPYGGMNPEQLETMAELAEEYSDGIGHITTRQDFQLHFIHIDDTPSVMRRLAAMNRPAEPNTKQAEDGARGADGNNERISEIEDKRPSYPCRCHEETDEGPGSDTTLDLRAEHPQRPHVEQDVGDRGVKQDRCEDPPPLPVVNKGIELGQVLHEDIVEPSICSHDEEHDCQRNECLGGGGAVGAR